MQGCCCASHRVPCRFGEATGGGRKEDLGPHAKIVHTVGKLGHRAALRIARLRYLPRVLSTGPKGLRVCLDHMWEDKGSWVQELRKDLLWMNQLTNKNDVPGADLEQYWLEFGKAHGKKFRGLVAEAARRELFRQRQ
eukprot:8104846-Pyramimonas_sp.AAC.1